MTTLSIDHMGKRAQFSDLIEDVAAKLYALDVLLSPPEKFGVVPFERAHQAARDFFRDAARRAVALQLPDLARTASSRAIDYAIRSNQLDTPGWVYASDSIKSSESAVSVVAEHVAEDALNEYSGQLLKACREAEARLV